MTHATRKIKVGRRARLLTVIATAVYAALVMLTLYELDGQRYMAAKRQLIAENFRELFPLPDNLNALAREALFANDPAGRRDASEKLRTQMSLIVSGPTSIYEMVLRDPGGTIALSVSQPKKIDELNTFENNLILRSFRSITDQPVTSPNDGTTTKVLSGRLIARYTSPVDNPLVAELTDRYRGYAVAVLVVSVIGYFLLLRFLLRPLENVTTHLEASRRAPPTLIDAPRGLIENSFNDMAARALLQFIEESAHAVANAETTEQRDAQMNAAVAFAARAFSATQLQCGRLGEIESVPQWLEHFALPDTRELSSGPLAEIGSWSARALSENPRSPAWRETDTTSLHWCAPPAELPFVFLVSLAHDCPNPAPRLVIFRQVAEILHRGFTAFSAAREAIARQRSEANIVLSRNLGHDLTNIIATGKLDLMAIRRITAADAPALDDTRLAMLRESVEGLMQSNRFLQEIVNIYRSFSYVKRPAYERHDLCLLIGQFLDTFAPTVSASIRIERDLTHPIPRLIVEPRLLTVALFNVMTNAADVLKRDDTPRSRPATIRVSATYSPDRGEATISVEDTGPGVRDAQGHRLDASSIDAIFEYGYSTKPERGEGLGLHWVKTIIQEFHGGEVRAENVPESGARISLVLRSMDEVEARVGDAPPRPVTPAP